MIHTGNIHVLFFLFQFLDSVFDFLELLLYYISLLFQKF